MYKVLIGIQARSTSTRLPNKASEIICGVSILDRVIDSCLSASTKIAEKIRGEAVVAVLTPIGDSISENYKDRCPIFEGDESNVLSRYMDAMNELSPDYIVRITGDCPLIPSSTIISLTLLAVNYGYDYISNVDERFRTSIDGVDCEVISSRLMKFTGEVARESADKEHVTTLIRRRPPPWAKMATALNHFDQSHLKYSVDTPEDLATVREAFESAHSKYQSAIRTYGKGRVHRI
jgi:spore coat polysaccharide biosynthesis protein SpsF (cytidylyltransferase family)